MTLETEAAAESVQRAPGCAVRTACARGRAVVIVVCVVSDFFDVGGYREGPRAAVVVFTVFHRVVVVDTRFAACPVARVASHGEGTFAIFVALAEAGHVVGHIDACIGVLGLVAPAVVGAAGFWVIGTEEDVAEKRGFLVPAPWRIVADFWHVGGHGDVHVFPCTVGECHQTGRHFLLAICAALAVCPFGGESNFTVEGDERTGVVHDADAIAGWDGAAHDVLCSRDSLV